MLVPPLIPELMPITSLRTVRREVLTNLGYEVTAAPLSA